MERLKIVMTLLQIKVLLCSTHADFALLVVEVVILLMVVDFQLIETHKIFSAHGDPLALVIIKHKPMAKTLDFVVNLKR